MDGGSEKVACRAKQASDSETRSLEFPKVIVRHAPPSKLDQAQSGTKCHVLKPMTNQVDVYIQIASNEEDPVWEYSGAELVEG